MSTRKRLIVAGVMAAVLAAAGAVAYNARQSPDAQYRTAMVERGDIVSTISATGTLNAVTTVQVGTQVSGTIQKLFVDFNSPVKKGEVIARIDQAIFNAQLEQARGNFLSAQANLAKARVATADAKRTLERNRQLLKDGIISQSELDAAQTAYDTALAAASAGEAAVVQTRGGVRQSETNRAYSVIRSPVDGVVISRAVDVGQTVAASFQTPTLFTIAQDLTKMQIETSVDESDISRARVGQPVTFTVDAYPNEKFRGTVTQVRNAPVTVSNVVTYVVVVGVDNRDLRLKPGMTANVAIETLRRDKVLKIPAAALRFRPAASIGKQQESSPAGKKEKSGERVFVPGGDGKTRPVPVTTGIASDSFVELVSGELKENDQVIIGTSSAAAKKSGSGTSHAPMGPRF